MEIKDLIIFLLIFIIIMWLQNNDDNKFKKKRESLYDIIKLPLFVSLVILIIKDINCKIYDNFDSFFIYKNLVKTDNIKSNFNYDDSLNDIFIGPPDF
jgi:hypothetical protein